MLSKIAQLKHDHSDNKMTKFSIKNPKEGKQALEKQSNAKQSTKEEILCSNQKKLL